MSGSVSLVDVVTVAFAPGGPVERVLGQHRPPQSECAIALARYVQDHTSGPNIEPWVQQQRAGIGKTYAVASVVSFDYLLTGRRSILSTYTRALRSNYLDLEGPLNEILRRTCQQLGGPKYSPVHIASHVSITEWISPAKVRSLEQQISTRTVAIEPYLPLLDYFAEAVDHGEDPTFDGLFEAGHVLPPGTVKTDWCLCEQDRGSPLLERIKRDNMAAHDAELLLVTHAMLIRNSISNGDVLKTLIDEDAVRTGILVIDEADKLPNVALEEMNAQVSFSQISDVLRYALEVMRPTTADGQESFRRGRGMIDAGREKLSTWMDEHRINLRYASVFDEKDSQAGEFVDAARSMADGFDRLFRIATGAFHDRDHDVLAANVIRTLQHELWGIVSFAERQRPKLSIAVTLDADENADIILTANWGAGRSLINAYWRPPLIHSLSGVAALSASLADLPPQDDQYKWFLRVMGCDLAVDRVHTLPPIPTDRRYHFGHIEEVTVACRASPSATDINQSLRINKNFVEWLNVSVSALARLQMQGSPLTRFLALFPSYDLLDLTWETMPELHERIIRMQRGSNLASNIREYAKRPHGIWFGTQWEGVNFVDPEPPYRTLIDILAITRLPQPPPDPIRIARIADVFGMTNPDAAAVQRDAERLALREGNIGAYHRTTQGMGRPFRRADDVLSLLAILDARFPVPDEIVAGRKIAKSAHDDTKLFANFDRILEPYHVQRWSQMQLDGSIESLSTDL